jgi:4-hydroxy-3-methylbut-2-en-1-yl diphosphate synthase IspG/GcpE
MVRVTVNVPDAAVAVPEIKQWMLDAAALPRSLATSTTTAIRSITPTARALDKYRINPGNVGMARGVTSSSRRSARSRTTYACAHRRQRRLPPGARHDEDAGENTDRNPARPEEIIDECMVSAIQ